MNLTICQNNALEYIRDMEEGEFLFLTGKAGTGKSFLLDVMKKEFQNITVASTGLAAVNVGGVTAHSMFGLSLGIYEPGNFSYRIRKESKEAIESAEYLFIDEVSMLRADTIDAVSDSCKIVRDDKRPFGGLKVVAIGDVYQLPPIVKKEETETFEGLYRSAWFFDAFCIKPDMPIIELQEVKRQKEHDFIHALNSSRIGEKYGLDLINSRVARKSRGAIELVAFNKQADAVNMRELDKINTKAAWYYGSASGDFKESEYPVSETLVLKEGARVVIMKNSQDYRNGDMGTIKKTGEHYCTVELDRGGLVNVERATWEKFAYTRDAFGKLCQQEIGRYSQLPLRLGYAISIHKSQGQTYDRCHLNISGKMFAPGQAYVALSRCKSLEGMTLERPVLPRDVFADKRVLDFMETANFVGGASNE